MQISRIIYTLSDLIFNATSLEALRDEVANLKARDQHKDDDLGLPFAAEYEEALKIANN